MPRAGVASLGLSNKQAVAAAPGSHRRAARWTPRREQKVDLLYFGPTRARQAPAAGSSAPASCQEKICCQEMLPEELPQAAKRKSDIRKCCQESCPKLPRESLMSDLLESAGYTIQLRRSLTSDFLLAACRQLLEACRELSVACRQLSATSGKLPGAACQAAGATVLLWGAVKTCSRPGVQGV